LKLKATLLAGAATLICLGSANAATVFSENFDSYTVGNLVGQGGWTQLGTSTTNPLQVTADKNVPMTTGQDAQRALDSTVTHTDGHSLVIDFDLTATTGDPDDGGDFFLSINPSLGSTAYSGRVYAKAGTGADTFQLAMAGVSISATDRVFGSDLNFNTPHHVTATWNFVPGDINDTFALMVDGAPYVTAPWGSTDPGDAEPTTFGVLTLRQGGANASNVVVDNIVVSDVVPEPASLSLLALGGLGALPRRRRRQPATA
jgi:hypothetical protein